MVFSNIQQYTNKIICKFDHGMKGLRLSFNLLPSLVVYDNMIAFVGTSPFLRISLRVAMATMHFYIAQTGLFLGNILFSHLGGPREHFGTHEKLSLGAR